MKKIMSILALTALMSLMLPQISYGFCTDSVDTKYDVAARNLFENGVLKGNPDGSCTLNNGINRIEFAVLAMRAAIGDEDAKNGACTAGMFKDLNDCSVWYGPYAAVAKQLGVLKGDGNGNLRPTDPVNAAEAAVIAARATGLTIPDPAAGQTWYDPAFNLYKGHNVTTYDPNYKMKRGDVVLMIHQISENYSTLISYQPSYDTAPAQPGQPSQPGAGSVPATSSGQIPQAQLNYRVLVEYFEYLTPQEIAYIFRTLDDTQQLSLGIYSPFGSLTHLMACQADQSIIFNDGSGNPKDCAYTYQDWSYTSQPYFTPDTYSYQKRNSLLISIQCATGEIDQGSCSAYAGAVSNYNTMSNNTSMRIITNMGGNGCLVGDPGCVPY